MGRDPAVGCERICSGPWKVARNYPCLFDETVKLVLSFATSKLNEAWFLTMDNIKTIYRNELDQLIVTKIEVDAKSLLNKNRYLGIKY